jgi:hypothetical protein
VRRRGWPLTWTGGLTAAVIAAVVLCAAARLALALAAACP